MPKGIHNGKRGRKSKAEQCQILLDEIAALVPPVCPYGNDYPAGDGNPHFYIILVPRGEEPKQYAEVCPGCGLSIEGIQYVVAEPRLST